MNEKKPKRKVVAPGSDPVTGAAGSAARSDVEVRLDQAGKASKLEPLSALQQWGVYFVAVVGIWILLVGVGVLVYAAYHHPELPSLAGMTKEQATEALNNYKQLSDLWRDSLIGLFDVLVTKTTLPIVTLLLGYLFGKKE